MKYAFRKLLYFMEFISYAFHNLFCVQYSFLYSPHIWYVALDLFYVTHFKITDHDKSLFVPKEWVRFVPRVWAENI